MCTVTSIRSALQLHALASLALCPIHSPPVASTSCGAREYTLLHSPSLASIMLPRCTSSRIIGCCGWRCSPRMLLKLPRVLVSPCDCRLPTSAPPTHSTSKHSGSTCNEASTSSRSRCSSYSPATTTLQHTSMQSPRASLRSCVAPPSLASPSRALLHTRAETCFSSDISTVQSLGCFACPQASWPRLPSHHVRFVRCAEWRRQYARCVEQLDVQWTLDAYDNAAPTEWIKETRQLLNRVRTAIRKEEKRMQRSHPTPLEANPAAQVHRMLDSSELPAQIHAVVDKNGDLTATSQELEDALVDHFFSVFVYLLCLLSPSLLRWIRLRCSSRRTAWIRRGTRDCSIQSQSRRYSRCCRMLRSSRLLARTRSRQACGS